MTSMDYSLTWEYIVKQMREKYGIRIDSTEHFSKREITMYIESIYDEYFEQIHRRENS